jgi:DNA-binding NtrC family response regulator
MLPGPIKASAGREPLALDGLTLDAAEKVLIQRALQRTDSNVSEAARQLGVTRMTLRYRMKQQGLEGA